MYGQGQYEIFSPEEMLAAVERDGHPRFIVCSNPLLAELLEGQVDPSEELSLFLRLDPSCCLYYMNACDQDDNKQNIVGEAVFSKKNPNRDTAPRMLVDAENGVAFWISREVNEGEQLLHFFPSCESIKRMKRTQLSNTEMVGGDGVVSPRRSTRAASRAAEGPGT